MDLDKCLSLMAAAGFPVLIIALIPLRVQILPMMFTAKELRIMDAPTADSNVVLASLGGKPRMSTDEGEHDDAGSGSSDTKHDCEDNITAADRDKWSAAERGVKQEGMRERAGAWKEDD